MSYFPWERDQVKRHKNWLMEYPSGSPKSQSPETECKLNTLGCVLPEKEFTCLLFFFYLFRIKSDHFKDYHMKGLHQEYFFFPSHLVFREVLIYKIEITSPLSCNPHQGRPRSRESLETLQEMQIREGRAFFLNAKLTAWRKALPSPCRPPSLNSGLFYPKGFNIFFKAALESAQ